MDIKHALALADDPDTSPALRALSLQLRAVESRSVIARKRADEAKANLESSVREGMAASAEAKALVEAIRAVGDAETARAVATVEASRVTADVLDAAHEALGVDVAARTAHEGTC